MDFEVRRIYFEIYYYKCSIRSIIKYYTNAKNGYPLDGEIRKSCDRILDFLYKYRVR